MSINQQREEQNVVYSYNGILFSHKKEWISDTHCNMDDPWKHYVKRKKPDTKGLISCDSTDMKCPE